MRTSATFTLKIFSTAPADLHLVGVHRHLEGHRVAIFLLLHALLGHRAAAAAPAGGLSCHEPLLRRDQGLPLEHDAVVPHELVDGHVARASRASATARSGRRAPASALGSTTTSSVAPPVDAEPAPGARPAPSSSPRRARAAPPPRAARRRSCPSTPPGARRAAHLARHRLVVLPGRGPERLAAALPLGGPDRALARPAGALLLPRLRPPPETSLRPSCRGCPCAARPAPAPPPGAASGTRGRRAEHVARELERAARLAARVDDVTGTARHRYFGLLRLLLLRLGLLHALAHSTSPPMAPGTAPRSRSRFCSGITRATARLSTVRRIAAHAARQLVARATRGRDPTRRRSTRAPGGTSSRGSHRRRTSRGA